MKHKRINIVFRIVLMLTFVVGMIYLISFVSLAGAPARMTSDEFLSACRRWTYIFFGYLGMTVASAVLSVIAMKGAIKPSAILRTGTIAFAAVANILAVRYIAVFRGYEDAVDAAKAVDSLVDTGTVFIIMSFAGAMLLFFLLISSVYDIIVTMKYSEEAETADKK